MDWGRWLSPRDATSAARAVTALWIVTGVLGTAAAVAQAVAVGGGWLPATIVAVISVMGSVSAHGLRHTESSSRWWLLVPFVLTGWIVTMAFLLGVDRDRIALLLFFPAMYAARQLPRRTAVSLILGCAVLAAGLALTERPLAPALLDMLFVDGVLLTTMLRLTRSGARLHDQLSLLQREAARDPLTGLSTRRALDDALHRPAEEAVTTGTALLLLDVDGFKQVNDTYGHPAGDAVLIQIAALLHRGTRAADLAARLGGDELAVILDDVSENVALRRAEALRHDIEAHVFTAPGDVLISVTASVGLAHQVGASGSLENLYSQADAALYAAKQSGRNRVIIHPALTQTAEARR